MKAKYLIGAVAASALMTGAAYAQLGQNNQTGSGPAGGTPATTSMPTTPGSTDASASSSMSGSVNGSMSGSVSTPSAGASATTSSDMSTPATAASATSYGAGASVTTTMVTNGPVPDTPENRAKYGQPMSHAGKRTAPAGN